MNFPLFLQGVPAIDMPIAPTQYPMLNFLPAIQVLKMNEKKPAAASTAKTGKDDVDVEGVKGHVEQWQNLYDAAVSKANKILAYQGENAINDPNYKKAMYDISQLESPAVKNTLKEYRSNLERYKANTKDKGTLFNIEEGFKTGIFSTHNYWRNYLDQSQTQDIGKTDQTANPWLKNFNDNPTIISFDDAMAQIKENNKTGTSESNYTSGRNDINEFALGPMAGLVKYYNKNVSSYRSNYNAFGERNMVNGQVVTEKGPDGKPLPVDPGQLDYALKENQRQAFQAFNLSSKISQGLFQDFAARTSGVVQSSDREMSGEPFAFKRRLDLGLTKEQSATLDATLDGYYYRPGTIRDGVDVSGQLDEESMMSDYKNHANDILATQYEQAKIEYTRVEDDQDMAYYNQNEEQTRSWMAAKEAEAHARAALQSQTTITSTYDQGYSEKDMLELLGAEGKDESILGGIVNGFKDFFGFGDGVSSQTTVNDATFDPSSPFTTMVGSDGQVRYIPKNAEDFNVEEYRYKIWNTVKKNNPEWTDNDIKKEVDKRVNAATKLLNNATKRRYSESGMGEQRTEMTQLEWTSQSATPGFIETVQNAFFGKDANGGWFGKKANEVLGNVDIKIGETMAEGRSLLGNIPIVSASNNLLLGAFAYASNCGFRTEKEITLDGKKIPAGSFVHMSKLDGVSPEKINELVKNKSIFIGSGYWTKDGKKDGQNPDRTSVVGMGQNGKDILDAINMNDRDNPQSVLNSSSNYYSTLTAGGDYNMVIKELTGKTFKLDVPQYAVDPEGKSAYDFALRAVEKSKVGNINTNSSQGPKDMDTNPQYKYSVNINKTADELGLVGKNRQEFLAEAKNKTSSEVAKLGGKYYGQQSNASKNWSMKPVVHNVQIVENGVVNQAFKNTVGWQETGSGSFWGGNGTRKAYFNFDANVTQALQKSSNTSVRLSAQTGLDRYYETNSQKKPGNIKSQSGEIILPVNARK